MSPNEIRDLAARLHAPLEKIGSVLPAKSPTPAITLIPHLAGPIWVLTPVDEGCFTLRGGYGLTVGLVGSVEGGLDEIVEQVIAATAGQIVEYLRISDGRCESIGYELSFKTGAASAGVRSGPGVIAARLPAWISPPVA